jgi:hypothetical protein
MAVNGSELPGDHAESAREPARSYQEERRGTKVRKVPAARPGKAARKGFMCVARRRSSRPMDAMRLNCGKERGFRRTARVTTEPTEPTARRVACCGVAERQAKMAAAVPIQAEARRNKSIQ